MTDVARLWLHALQAIVDRAAHELKDALNGVSLNLEVVRSRSGAADKPAASLAPFAEAGASQLETLGARIEALLALARPARGPADVAVTLRQMGTLLVPAARADGGELRLEGIDGSAPTGADPMAVRLALASGLLAATPKGAAGRCRLADGPAAVVHFSHESAGACEVDPAVTAALAGHAIHVVRSGEDLTIAFPGTT